MTYDGKTSVDTLPQTRITADLDITKLAVGRMDNNCYLLRDRATGASLLIDAAAEPDRILAMCGGKLDAVLTTHGHADHWGALQEVVDATGATTYAHPADAESIPVPTDVLIDEGDVVEVGSVRLTPIHLVGHTPGSLALIHRDSDGSSHIWTGDCLFPGGIGNTWGDDEAFTTLLNGVAAKIFAKLPDDTWVYPGHGWDTTVGSERPSLQEWTIRHW